MLELGVAQLAALYSAVVDITPADPTVEVGPSYVAVVDVVHSVVSVAAAYAAAAAAVVAVAAYTVVGKSFVAVNKHLLLHRWWG